MTDLRITRSETGRRAGRKPRGVTMRRVRTAAGQTVTIRAIDAHSPTFGEDFLYVFTRNVEAARDENQRLLASRGGDQPED